MADKASHKAPAAHASGAFVDYELKALKNVPQNEGNAQKLLDDGFEEYETNAAFRRFRREKTDGES